MNEILNAIVRFEQTRWAYCMDERGKAMQRGDKVAEEIYQVILDERFAAIEYYRSLIK